MSGTKKVEKRKALGTHTRKSSTEFMIDGHNLVLEPEEYAIANLSLQYIQNRPHFKGIRTRIPEYHAMDTKGGKHNLVPHIKAVVTMMGGCMAMNMYSENLTLQVILTIYPMIVH